MRPRKEVKLDVIYLFYLLKRYWGIFLVSLVVGIVAAFIYNELAKPLYKSEISIFTWNRNMSEAIDDVKKKQVEKKTDKVEELMMYNNIISQSLHVGQRLISDYMNIMSNPQVRKMTDEKLVEKGFKPPLKYSFRCKKNRDSCIMKIEVIAENMKLASAAADALVDSFKIEQQRLMDIRYAESMYPATVPSQPFSPNKKINLIIGFFLGLLFGGMVSFFLDFQDTTIKNPDDLRNLNLLPLGCVPNYKDIGMLCWEDDNLKTGRSGNSVLDAVRIISATISFLRVDNPPKVIVFTSSLPGSGKSTQALLLAKIKGAGNTRVLLISCDLRKPFIYDALRDSQHGGLVNYLKDTQCNEPEKYIHCSILPGVDIMTHGIIPPNPTDLLESKRFADMIEHLKGKYDCILLDSPPCSGMADAMILGKVADAIVMVVEAGKTKMNDVFRSLEQFDSLREKVMGAILNKVSYDKSSEYYYSYGYYYQEADSDNEKKPSGK